MTIGIADFIRDLQLGASKGLNVADKQALIDITNAADRNDDTIKSDVVTKLKAINPALTITTASTWTDIRAAINSVPTGDANPADVKNGKKFMNASGQQTGTMVNKAGQVVPASSATGSAGNVAVKVPDGFYDTNTTINAADANFTAANTKAGVTVYGVAGTFTSDATAVAADIISGKSGYVNGVKVTGTMVNVLLDTAVRAAPFPSGAAGNLAIPTPNGYHNGINVMANDPDFIAANFRADKNVFGLQGSMPVRNAMTVGLGAAGTATRLQIQVPQGYWDGATNVYYDDPEFIAANILNTANLFGLQGSAIAGRKEANGSGTGSNASPYPFTVSGLSFQPKLVVLSHQLNDGVGNYTPFAIWVSKDILGTPSDWGLVRGGYVSGGVSYNTPDIWAITANGFSCNYIGAGSVNWRAFG